jgi:hypothetical protein
MVFDAYDLPLFYNLVHFLALYGGLWIAFTLPWKKRDG